MPPTIVSEDDVSDVEAPAASAPVRRKRVTSKAPAPAADPAVEAVAPVAPPAPTWPDKNIPVPAMEPLQTSFGVELEIRPKEVRDVLYAGNPGEQQYLAWWRPLAERLLRGGLIDPDRVEQFKHRMTVSPMSIPRLASHQSGFVASKFTGVSSPYFSAICDYLHPEIVAGLAGLTGSADGGGDELRTGILTDATAATRFMHCLYSVASRFYDFVDIEGAGMHIHVGRSNDGSHTRNFERFMISREWVFQLLVPRYRRNGYNRVWRTDTLAALTLRGAVAGNRSATWNSAVAQQSASGGGTTFDGDIQQFFEAQAIGYCGQNLHPLPPGLTADCCAGSSGGILSSPLPSTHGHWICGGRSGRTTEFRLFAPPPNPTDVLNWIRLLNFLWTFTRDNPDAARRRSAMTPWLSAHAAIHLLTVEAPGIPADLVLWMRRLATTYNGNTF